MGLTIWIISRLLKCDTSINETFFSSPNYEFLLFTSIEDMINHIKRKNVEKGLSRLIAGYSWEWVSNKNKKLFDIKIGNVELRWNSVSVDWVNSDKSGDEVGCIHTTQGYDLNYAGVIFGNEISYDIEKNEVKIIKENYFDKNGKNSITNPADLKDFIINIYKTIMMRGINGTFVYACDENLKSYFLKHIPRYIKEGSIDNDLAFKNVKFENSAPFYDIKAAAGNFSKLQEAKDILWIKVPARYKSDKDLFACRVEGESMNKVIPNGSICLFRKYDGGSRNGRIVLVE
ncbi:MAG TPA: DNA/RNA helicase domain-containing protein, partial [Aquella sp.]|nr:DNA/RNA helicase domain-containing protein [Aquella sp.]